jgi:hypothetical protein
LARMGFQMKLSSPQDPSRPWQRAVCLLSMYLCYIICTNMPILGPHSFSKRRVNVKIISPCSLGISIVFHFQYSHVMAIYLE